MEQTPTEQMSLSVPHLLHSFLKVGLVYLLSVMGYWLKMHTHGLYSRALKKESLGVGHGDLHFIYLPYTLNLFLFIFNYS